MINAKVGFDIDGVFVPDLVYTEHEHDHLLYMRHNKLLPIFEPVTPYVMITGRPKCDEPHTIKWIDKFFRHHPQKVFHDNSDWQRAWEYKAATLNDNKYIELFIESCPVQTAQIAEACPHVRVITFSEFIRENLPSI